MTSLLGSLVERSLRAPSAAAAGPLSPDAATRRDREGGPADNSPPGALMPRRRSRYERPTAEPALDIVEESPDATADTPPPEPQPGHPDDPVAVRRVPAQRQRAARRASDAPPHHAAVEPAARPVLADTPPVVEPAAASPRPREAPPITASVDRPARSSTGRADAITPRRESAPPARGDVAAAPVSMPAPERSSTAELAPAPPPRPGPAPVAHIAVPPSAVPAAEPTAVRRGELAPVRQRDPLRDALRRSDPSGSQPSTARPAAPSVRVSIGRVEVRAVFASPPSPARRPAAAPTMALEDYLKQREKGS